MENKLVYGRYRITSVGRKEYLGVSRVKPDIYPPPPVPVIVVRPGVLPSEFIVVPVDVDVDTYVILDEKRVTRDQENRVFAFENEPAEVWLIKYNKEHDAYTIEKREVVPDIYIGWTAPLPDESADPDQILLRPLLEPNPFQLFKFERVGLE